MKKKIIGLFAIVLAIMVSSCVPQKKMLLLKDAQMKTEELSQVYVNERSIEYKLQPGDNLYIRAVNVVDEKNAAMFNGESSRSTSNANDVSIYLTCYTVDGDGCIELPLVGKVVVKDLTVNEAKEKLQTSINQYLKETMLIVKLANFNLTVLGEVNRPGTYKIYQSQINLLEAISMAGNMTNFAKNSEVKIVRQTETGSEIVTVDMGQADILSSPYYYLKPNDIIYIEPMKIKQWGFTTFPYSTVISIITLGVTLFTLLKK
ncbi:MAG: polysaccharide biosynthesis/export family protein [Bacteroidales bacterium]|nr:polysaccharide biosynthesis/export family protein [Bacteroidales bacterium]